MPWNTKHLVVLYHRDEDIDPDAPFDYYALAQHPLVESYPKTGWFVFLNELTWTRSVGMVTVVVESSTGCGKIALSKHVNMLVVPNLRILGKLLYHNWIPRPNVMFLVHGRCPEWMPFIEQWRKANRWILQYPASSIMPGDGLPSIALNEAIEKPIMNPAGYLEVPFLRPVNDKQFFPHRHSWAKSQKKTIDLCYLQNSLTTQADNDNFHSALKWYEAKYGIKLNFIMPYSDPKAGVVNAGINDFTVSATRAKINEHKLRNILSKSEAVLILNKDCGHEPGCIEAFACGCPLILGSPAKYPSFLSSSDRYCAIIPDPTKPDSIAQSIHQSLVTTRHWQRRDDILHHFLMNNDMDRIVVPRASDFFDKLFAHIKADIGGLEKDMENERAEQTQSEC